jgi:hypothetical protein
MTRLTDSDTAPIVQSTEYALGKLDEAYFWSDVYRLVTNKDGGDTLVSATKHYFSDASRRSTVAPRRPANTDFPHPDAAVRGGAFRSTDFLAPDSNGNLVTKRRT